MHLLFMLFWQACLLVIVTIEPSFLWKFGACNPQSWWDFIWCGTRVIPWLSAHVSSVLLDEGHHSTQEQDCDGTT